MKNFELKYDMSQIDQVVKEFAQRVQDKQVITFTGSLGAGKTTFVSHLLRNWGVQGPVTSPTFTYMNVYHLSDGRVAYHFDLYRLGNLEEFEQAGFTEYLYQENSICLIEWPEVISSLLTQSVSFVSLEFIDQDTRKLQYNI